MTESPLIPSDPPRTITAAMRYRALAAKPVSMLLLICLVIVVVCLYTAREHIQDSARVHRLKSVGRTTQAVVTKILDRRPTGERGAAREYITFEFTPPGSPDAQPVTGERLGSWFIRQIKLRDTLEVVYDPADPDNFFCPEVDDHSLLGRLAAQIVFLVIAFVLSLLALLRHVLLLGIIRNGSVQRGKIVDIGPTSQGAFSRLLVVSFRFADHDVIVKRVVPFRLVRHLIVGDSIDLLVPSGKPRRAVAAAAFL